MEVKLIILIKSKNPINSEQKKNESIGLDKFSVLFCITTDKNKLYLYIM